MRNDQQQAVRLRLLLLVLTGAALLALLAVVPFEQFRFWGWDVAVFRAGSKALLHGDNPYDPQNVVAYSDGAELASIPYYVYSPFFAIMIAPLTLVSPEVASRAWFVINLICMLGGSLLILRETSWAPSPRRLALLAFGLAAFPPTRTLLVIGQSTGVMLLLLAIAASLNARGRDWLAGVALGMALFKPHLILVPLFLLARRQWRFLIGTVATIVVTVLPFVSLLDDWALALIQTRAINLGYGCLDFSSVNMLLRCLELDSVGFAAALALTAAASIWLFRLPADPGTQRYLLQLGLVIGLTIVVLDNVRVADLVLLIVPGLMAIQSAARLGSTASKRAVVTLLVAGYCFPYLAQAYGALRGSPLLYSLPIWYAGTAATIFLAAWLSTAVHVQLRVEEA